MSENDRSVYRNKDGKWVNKRHGATRAGGLHDTQLKAENSARQMLLNSGGGELNVHGRNGQIRSKDTIGKNDPFPPKDSEH